MWMRMPGHDYELFSGLWNYGNFITGWLWEMDGYDLWYAIFLHINEKNERKFYMKFTS